MKAIKKMGKLNDEDLDKVTGGTGLFEDEDPGQKDDDEMGHRPQR